MELVRKFPQGNAIEQPRVPWYEAVVSYTILAPAIITWFIGIPLLISYWECLGDGAAACASSDLLRSSSGSYTGIVLMALLSYVVAVTCAVVVQFTVRKLFFALVWTIAVVCLLTSFYAYGLLSGMAGTPWGHLVQLT